MKKLLILPILSMVLFACQSPGGEKNKDTTANVEKAAKTVKTTPIAIESISVVESYNATIHPEEIKHIAPTMPGRIKRILVDINDDVAKGQLLVEMDETQLKQLEVQYKNAKQEMTRMNALIKHGSVSQQIYDQTKAGYESAKTTYENAKDNTKLLSPMDGVVTNRYFENEDVFSGAPNTQVGKPAIITIQQIEKLKVMIDVSERYFPLVKKGMETTLTCDIYPDKEFKGEVFLVYPTIDATTRTFGAEILIPNKNKVLRPGMFSRIKLNLGEKSAIMAPSSSVLLMAGSSERYVYIAENNVAKRINVTIGERFDDKLEIISPDLKIGDQLIVSGQTKLETGDKLTIVE